MIVFTSLLAKCKKFYVYANYTYDSTQYTLHIEFAVFSASILLLKRRNGKYEVSEKAE